MGDSGNVNLFLPTREEVRDAAFRCQASAGNHLSMASLDNVLDSFFKGLGTLGSLLGTGSIAAAFGPTTNLAAAVRQGLFGNSKLGSVAFTVSVLSFGLASNVGWGSASTQHLEAGKKYNVLARRARFLIPRVPEKWVDEKGKPSDVAAALSREEREAILAEWRAFCAARDKAEESIKVNTAGGCIHEQAKYSARQRFKELRADPKCEPTKPALSRGQRWLMNAVYWFS